MLSDGCLTPYLNMVTSQVRTSVSAFMLLSYVMLTPRAVCVWLTRENSNKKYPLICRFFTCIALKWQKKIYVEDSRRHTVTKCSCSVRRWSYQIQLFSSDLEKWVGRRPKCELVLNSTCWINVQAHLCLCRLISLSLSRLQQRRPVLSAPGELHTSGLCG